MAHGVQTSRRQGQVLEGAGPPVSKPGPAAFAAVASLPGIMILQHTPNANLLTQLSNAWVTESWHRYFFSWCRILQNLCPVNVSQWDAASCLDHGTHAPLQESRLTTSNTLRDQGHLTPRPQPRVCAKFPARTRSGLLLGVRAWGRKCASQPSPLASGLAVRRDNGRWSFRHSPVPRAIDPKECSPLTDRCVSLVIKQTPRPLARSYWSHSAAHPSLRNATIKAVEYLD